MQRLQGRTGQQKLDKPLKILVSKMIFQTVQNKKILKVCVHEGMREGHTVTFNGEADQEFGKDPGDVKIGNASCYKPLCPR